MPRKMMQQIILDNPDCVAEILKINKTDSYLQHYITMAIYYGLNFIKF